MSVNHVSASTRHLPKSHIFLTVWQITVMSCHMHTHFCISRKHTWPKACRLSHLLTQNPCEQWTVLTMEYLMQQTDRIQITEKIIFLSLLFCQSTEACKPELVSKDLALLGRNAFLSHLPLLGAGENNQCISVYLFKY